MDSPIITIPLEEYKELLELKIRTELESKYQAKIDEIKDELDVAQSSSSYWYNRAGELSKEKDELLKEIADLKFEGGDTNGRL